MKKFGTILFDPKQRRLFASGALVQEWARQFPSIFDEDDVRITQRQPSKHFFEWLAAIVIFSATGYLSLVEKYRNKNHKRKQRILARLFDDNALRHIGIRGPQCPNLLCYSPDFKECFFCEVKGTTDKVRQVQIERFEALQKVTGKAVCLLEFKNIERPTRPRTVFLTRGRAEKR